MKLNVQPLDIFQVGNSGSHSLSYEGLYTVNEPYTRKTLFQFNCYTLSKIYLTTFLCNFEDKIHNFTSFYVNHKKIHVRWLSAERRDSRRVTSKHEEMKKNIFLDRRK